MNLCFEVFHWKLRSRSDLLCSSQHLCLGSLCGAVCASYPLWFVSACLLGKSGVVVLSVIKALVLERTGCLLTESAWSTYWRRARGVLAEGESAGRLLKESVRGARGSWVHEGA
ncbi:hypothetical protein KSP39_PZI013414 [Platanthera zijinensis]|uniref:Uncharacterized protein n=1 Tax=Platanthera zijinensis TaxID=2320716 RepID=A0AAP0BEV0_9ASPA